MPPKWRTGPHPETGTHHTQTTTAQSNAYCVGLRRAASRRLEALDCGRSDPWWYEPTTVGYEAAALHLLEHGLTPAPNREGLQAMWRRGGHCRQAAEFIAEAWELAG
jgi:hypothetical protein